MNQVHGTFSKIAKDLNKAEDKNLEKLLSKTKNKVTATVTHKIISA